MPFNQKIIRDEIREVREDRYNNLELLDGTYLKNPEHPHTSFIHSNMMDCDKSCADILNISSGIFNKIPKTYKNAVGPMKSEIELDTNMIIEQITANGIVGVEKYKDENEEIKYEVVPSDEVFWTNSVPTRIIEFRLLDTITQNYEYYLMRRYYFEGETQTELFKMQSDKSLHGDVVEIESIPEGTELSKIMERYSSQEITGFEEEALYICEDGQGFNIVKSLVFAIERKIVASDNQVIQFVKQKLLLKGFGKMSDNQLEDDVWYQNPEATAEYLSKSNPYVLESWTLIEKQLKLISANTGIPIDEFGFEVSSALGVDSQKARRIALEQHVETLRSGITKIVYHFEGEEFEITWNPVSYTSDTEKLEKYKLAKEVGVMGQLDVVKDYWDLDDEAAIAKILEINQTNGQPETTESEVI